MGEIFVASAGDSSFTTISLRLATVYGARMKLNGVVGRFLEHAWRGEIIHVMGSPDSLFDFVYVRDVVRAIQCAIVGIDNRVSLHTVYNVGGGNGVTLIDLARICWKVYGPATFPQIVILDQGGGPTRNVLDVTLARQELGYEPCFGIEAGLLDMKPDLCLM
jgi:UDP-glucose 4-epimerase